MGKSYSRRTAGVTEKMRHLRSHKKNTHKCNI